MKNIILPILVVVLIIAAVVALSQGDNTSPTSFPVAPTESVLGGTDSDNIVTPTIRQFTISGQNFSFTPTEITVKKGDMVEITFTNISGFHDFVIDEYQIRTAQIQEGQNETIRFLADKTGSFEFYCSVGDHRSQGMVGSLIVE